MDVAARAGGVTSDRPPSRRQSRCARSSAGSSPSTTSTSRSRGARSSSLIGPNGAGKTTFFNMLTGVYRPTAGRVDLRRRGHRGQAAARGHRARDRPDVPEHPPLRADDGARERARRDALPAQGRHRPQHPPHARACGARRARRAARASELLAYCNLAGTDDEYARNLSYGDQRRLEVARALATEPKLLLLDEPTAGMNPQETLEFTAFVGRSAHGTRG